MFSFFIRKNTKKTRARAGILKTPHGKIYTPAFVPVATRGALRGIDFSLAKDIGAETFMINTFHFYINNTYKVVEKFGGLHKFLNKKVPLMTDSGGFQVFSLGFGMEEGVGKIAKSLDKNPKKKGKNLIKIDADGIFFSSPIDGSKHRLTPEISIKIQKILGADLIFAFDECTSPFASYGYVKNSLKKTHRWAEISLKHLGRSKKQAMFGILQGGNFRNLREESAKFISSLPFFGYGIGGSFGKGEMYDVLDWTVPLLSNKKPVHLLGIGEIDDIFESVERGVDLFDCVMPTRLARRGIALTKNGKVNLQKPKFLEEKTPIEKECKCFVCKNYKRAYLSHLVREKEIYSINLLVHHNLFFMLKLMEEIRTSILEDSFLNLKKRWMSNLKR